MSSNQQWSIQQDKKLLHQAKISQSVLDDVRAYKEYARSNGQSLNMNQITEDALQLLIRTHKDDMVAYLVNKGLDGDMETVNTCSDKIIRGKAKAMMIKIKRGSIDRPPIPEISEASSASETPEETQEQMIERLVQKGLGGDMDEINALSDRVMRGKIKAAIVKAKRAAK